MEQTLLKRVWLVYLSGSTLYHPLIQAEQNTNWPLGCLIEMKITVPKGKQFGYFDNQLHNIGWPFNIVPHNTGSTVLLSERKKKKKAKKDTTK